MRLGSILIIATACCASLTACPVDERTLEGIDFSFSGGSSGSGSSGQAGQGDGGDAGSSGGSSGKGGSTTGGSAGSPMQGGTGGTEAGGGGDAGSSTGGAPVGRCPDLDVNGVLDCEETLVTNATFDRDVLPWTGETTNIVADWDEEDAHEKTNSGSVAVENRSEASGLFGVRQCIAVEGGKAYNFAFEAMVPEEPAGASAGMIVNVYHTPACDPNSFVEVRQASYVGAGTGWRASSFTYLMPANAKSVAIRLLAQKLAGPPSRSYFDNILVNED